MSYELGPAFWAPDAREGTQGTVSQGQTHPLFTIPTNMPVGNRTLSEVRFPASKAHMWDRYQRDLGDRIPFFAHESARVPVLCVDGSVGLRSAAATNPGFNPADPTNPNPTTFMYRPGSTEPPTQNGEIEEQVVGRMRWTRWGLRGRDFNGPEVTAP